MNKITNILSILNEFGEKQITKRCKVKELFLSILIGLLVFILFPLAYNTLFISSSEKSTFLGIKSYLEIGDWFSFWVTLLTAIFSGYLTYETTKMQNSFQKSEYKSEQIGIIRTSQITSVNIFPFENISKEDVGILQCEVV